MRIQFFHDSLKRLSKSISSRGACRIQAVDDMPGGIENKYKYRSASARRAHGLLINSHMLRPLLPGSSALRTGVLVGRVNRDEVGIQ
jgi:hypothetical protein